MATGHTDRRVGALDSPHQFALPADVCCDKSTGLLKVQSQPTLLLNRPVADVTLFRENRLRLAAEVDDLREAVRTNTTRRTTLSGVTGTK